VGTALNARTTLLNASLFLSEHKASDSVPMSVDQQRIQFQSFFPTGFTHVLRLSKFGRALLSAMQTQADGKNVVRLEKANQV